MKLLFTTVLVLFCYVSVAQGKLFTSRNETKNNAPFSSLKLDKEFGFRGIILETNFNSFNNMLLVSDEGDVKFYTRTTDELKIGDVGVYSIKYCFYKSKLMMISITTNGLTNSQGLLNFLKSEYGEESESKNGSYFIMGQKAKLSFSKHPHTHEAKLRIMSLPLTYTMLQEENER